MNTRIHTQETQEKKKGKHHTSFIFILYCRIKDVSIKKCLGQEITTKKQQEEASMVLTIIKIQQRRKTRKLISKTCVLQLDKITKYRKLC